MNKAASRGKILVVDDDADGAWALSTMLQLEGWETREALDGGQAVDAASDMRPDAIVMDISMPGVDGIEAVGALRRLFGEANMPRLVAVTGLDPAAHRQRVLANGFDVYLTKPVRVEDLLASLRVA